MDARSLLLGLLVGGAGGAGVALWASSRDCAVRDAPVETRRDADVTPRLAGAAPHVETKAGATRSTLEQAIASGDASAVQEVLYGSRSRYKPSEAEIAAAMTLLTRALEKKDASLLRAAVAVLTAGSDDPRARSALAALVTGEDVPSDLLRSPFLPDALGTTPDPALARGARARFEKNLAAGETSWVAGDTWLVLVARHGSPEDVAWVAARKESSQIRLKAIDALARSRNPEAIRHFREAAATGVRQEFWSPLLEANPEDGLRLLEERWQALQADPPAGGEPGVNEVLTLWARHAPHDEAPRLARGLLRSADERLRIAAPYALTWLARRGFDLAEFEPLLLAPVVALENRAAAYDVRTSDPLARTAAYAIEYNPVTWSERAARALENAHAGGDADLKKVAAKVRAGLANPWRR